MAKKCKRLLYIANNRSSVTILVYRWNINKTAKYQFPIMTRSCDIEFHIIGVETSLNFNSS